jgi:DNA-binding HxlR family transcriptional regulator
LPLGHNTEYRRQDRFPHHVLTCRSERHPAGHFDSRTVDPTILVGEECSDHPSDIVRHARLSKSGHLDEALVNFKISLAVRKVLNRVGDKWSVQVRMLGEGEKRFSELRHGIEGISQRMLTLTLKGLERDGLIKRTAYPTIPPRVEYELTKLGRSLLQPITGLAKWAGNNREKIQSARTRYDSAELVTSSGIAVLVVIFW